MRWLIGTLIVIALLITAAFAVGYWAQQQTIQTFKTLGFQNFTYQHSRKTLGGVTFENISLDDENISTIDRIITSYALDKSTSLIIENLNLTGDTLSEATQFSGFNNKNFPFSLTNINLANALIRNAQLSLLTKNFGGLSLNFDGSITKENESLIFQSRFTSNQKQLSLSGQATTTLMSDSWAIEGEIEQAKFDLDTFHAKITRAQGQLSAQGSLNSPITTSSQINAGGLQLLATPWKNASATLETLGERKKIFLNAQSLSKSPIELSLTWEQNGTAPANINAEIFAENMQVLTTYLKKHEKTKLLQHLQSLSNDLEEITITIGHTIDQSVLITIKSQDKNIRTLQISPQDFI